MSTLVEKLDDRRADSPPAGTFNDRLYRRAKQRITPNLRSSQYTYYEALRGLLTARTRWLDMGCGHQVFASWMMREQQEVVDTPRVAVGIDLDWQGLRQHEGLRRRVFGDLTRLPFAAGSYDVVSANMVLEHLREPERVLAEVHRMLAPGGAFVFHTPNYFHWGTLVATCLPDRVKKILIRYLEHRVEADVFQTYYRINTTRAIGRLAEGAGFDVVSLAHVNSAATLKMLGPVVVFELLFMRLIEHPRLAGLRSNIVAVLRKR